MLAILISESPIFRPRFVCQPGGDQIDRLFAVDAAGPGDVWAVGLYSPNPVAEDHSLILHWNGSSWSVVQRRICVR